MNFYRHIFGHELIFRKYEPPKPPPPREKPVQEKIMKCLVMDKRMFTRERAAEEARLTGNPRIRFYCCEFCNHWHLTHKRNKIR